MYRVVRFFLLLMSGLSTLVFATALHISVYEADSTVEVAENGALEIRLNFQSNNVNDFENIRIYFVQGKQKEKMEVKRINDHMLMASIDNIKSNGQANLLVKYFYNNQWSDFKELDINLVDFPEKYFENKSLNNVVAPKVNDVMLAKDESIALANGIVIDSGSIVFYRNLSSELASSNQEKSNCVINYSGETLWSLSIKYSREWEHDLYSTILAIYYANPHAFYRKNINKIRSDARLFCPTLEMLTQFASKEQAKIEYRALETIYK